MSSSESLKSLPTNKVRELFSIYGDCLPFEVRCDLGIFIDQQPWHELRQEESESLNTAKVLLDSLLLELVLKAQFDENVALRVRYLDLGNKLYQSFNLEPFKFVIYMQHCLKEENRIIAEHLELVCILPPKASDNGEDDEMDGYLNALNEAKAIEATYKQLRQRQYGLASERLQIEGLLKAIKQEGSTEGFESEESCKDRLDSFKKKTHRHVRVRHAFLAKISRHLNCVALLVQEVDVKITSWRLRQQREGNWDNSKYDLDEIQCFVEKLLDLLWPLYVLVEKFAFLTDKLPIEAGFATQVTNATDSIKRLLKDLIQASFVVPEQPVRVLKTGNRVSCEVRLLIGPKFKGKVVYLLHY